MITFLIPHLALGSPAREAGLARCRRSIAALRGIGRKETRVLLDEPRLGVPRRIEAAWRETRGEWIVLAANDCEFEPDSVRLALEGARQHGKRLIAFNGGPLLADHGNICAHFLIHRSLAEELGGIFDIRFQHTGCDNYLWWRASRLGEAIRCEAAIVRHHHFSTGEAEMDEVYRLGWAHVEEDRALLRALTMRIAVYCITRNEEPFIARWADSAREADYRLVVDTGSTDRTLAVAQAAGAVVAGIHVAPWRFDDARNASLALLPHDIDLCIALDADEVLAPGWRQHLEQLPPGVTRPRYRYVWSWNADGTPDKTYGGDKIHARDGYRWAHPVHETLRSTCPERQHWVPGLEIHHHPDATKSRGQYLPLLKLSVEEDPDDDRNAFYYARELFFSGSLAEAAREFHRHLALPRAVWKPERAASMRYLSKCLPAEGRAWLLRAAAEAPERREPLVELARYEHDRQRWALCFAAATAALEITERPLDYITESAAWTWQPHDLAALSAHWLGMPEVAARHGAEAVRLCPGDERLRANLRWYQ